MTSSMPDDAAKVAFQIGAEAMARPLDQYRTERGVRAALAPTAEEVLLGQYMAARYWDRPPAVPCRICGTPITPSLRSHSNGAQLTLHWEYLTDHLGRCPDCSWDGYQTTADFLADHPGAA